MTLLVVPLVSAGVGVKWDKESSLVPEKTKTCMTYQVYNPWNKDSYVQIELSEELLPIVSSMESQSEFIPKQTSSDQAIPVEFCFKTPVIYEEDCLLFNRFMCEQDCSEPVKIYEGEVEVKEAGSLDILEGNTGGSSTTVSVSAPLRVRVQCLAHSRNYSLVYITVALIAGILLTRNLLKRKKNKKKK